MIARAEDAEKRNRKLHVDLTTAQAHLAALESCEVIAVEALKQAKDEHVQKLMEAYLVTHNQHRAQWIQEPVHPTQFNPGELKIPRFLKAMDKQEHPESSQGPPPELFEPLTMKKILALSREIKEEAASTPPAPPPSKEIQEPVRLEEEFNPVLPHQSPPQEVINISSLLTHPGDVSD
uniref:Uncharacterized protein n=1 Tax=Zea mays TaxID=4577 RepID=A0A804UL94_MAIZE